jgi:hypothetical protein
MTQQDIGVRQEQKLRHEVAAVLDSVSLTLCPCFSIAARRGSACLATRVAAKRTERIAYRMVVS